MSATTTSAATTTTFSFVLMTDFWQITPVRLGPLEVSQRTYAAAFEMKGPMRAPGLQE